MTRNILFNVFYTFAVAVILNLVVYFIGNAAGISWSTNQGIIGPVPVIAASMIGAAVGCIGYWILGLFAGESQRIWFIWGATILGVLSMLGPWTGANDLGTMVFLGLMHVVSVLVMTWYLGVWTPTYIAAEDVATA